MSQGNVVRANTHEEQDRILDSKQEENVECGKKKLIQLGYCSDIHEKYYTLPQSERNRSNLKQYSIDAG